MRRENDEEIAMKLNELSFRRRFSVNLYRNLRLPMGEMDFHKDWVTDTRGAPYPLLSRTEGVSEHVLFHLYSVSAVGEGSVRRLLGSFFPWNTYELTVREMRRDASIGFCLQGEAGDLTVRLSKKELTVFCEECTETYAVLVTKNSKLALTFRTGGISLYLNDMLIADISLKMMHAYRKEEIFAKATMSLLAVFSGEGNVELTDVRWYLCGGISHADIKPIRYEDGTPMIENGRVFLTVTSRLEAEMYQSVISWNPTLCDFRMEGAIFYDCGDGYWCSDVASSILFDRNSQKWLVWMAAFSHGHVLGRGVCTDDPRFGIHIIDVQLMESAEASHSYTDFVGFDGDEDPDLLYLDGKWHLAICRVEKDTGYHYYHFVSDDPFDGYVFVDRTPSGEKTGGLFVKCEEGYSFVCGSDFKARARYDVYPINDFSNCRHLHCDYDDGGFRGWGTIILLSVGGRKRYVWITFDRHNASRYNWSYGNLYVFDSEYLK